MIAADRLARLPLFQGASPAVVTALARRATVVHAAADEVLFAAIWIVAHAFPA